MLNFFQKNSFHILGLDSSASQKEIIKRSKEIINRLKIDDCPAYDLDICQADEFRRENLVKDAIQRLQAPKKRIKEYFFWFNVADSIDEQAYGLLQKRDLLNALRVWQNASDGNNAKSYFYKKNLAILYCLYLSEVDDLQYLRNSIFLWSELVNSDKFWDYFTKLYKLHDEQSASTEIISDFRETVAQHLSDIYSDLHQIRDSSDYINEFQRVFLIKGRKVEKNILEPIFQSIHADVIKLESLKVSDDGVLDGEEILIIKKLIGSIQAQFNKLIDFGLYDDSQAKIMRDRAASALKTIVLDLHNNLSETDKAISLLKIALKIVGTSGLETKINQEIKILVEIKNNAELIRPINDLISSEQYEKALNVINNGIQKNKGNFELREYYNYQKKLCISAIAAKNYKKAREYLDGKNEDLAKSIFEEIGRMIYDNLYLYDLSKEVIDNIFSEIEENIKLINIDNLGQFDQYRNSFVKLAQEKFGGGHEEMAMIILVDSKIYSGVADFLKKTRQKMGVVNTLNTIGWFTIWFYGIGLVFFVAAWIYKNNK